MILEGFYEVIQDFGMLRQALLYPISAMLFMTFLRSYYGVRFVKAGLRLLILTQQLFLIAYSLRCIVCQAETKEAILLELRATVLCFCAFLEIGVLAVDLGGILSETAKMTWEERRQFAARQGYGPPIKYI